MDNKIISFDSGKKKIKARRYKLKAQISVYISRKNNSYSLSWSSPENISHESIYKILKKIFTDISKEIEFLEYEKEDIYEVEFTLLYLEKDANTIKYICNSYNISKENLAGYLWLSLCIYKLKEKGVL